MCILRSLLNKPNYSWTPTYEIGQTDRQSRELISLNLLSRYASDARKRSEHWILIDLIGFEATDLTYLDNDEHCCFKMGWTRPLFVYFGPFLNTMTNITQNLTINGRSIDGVHGIRTRDRTMVGADEPTELTRPTALTLLFITDYLFMKWAIPTLWSYYVR